MEVLMNDHTEPVINLPVSVLEACVKSQVALLETLHEKGWLK